MTPGVALLVHTAMLVASSRGWDKKKLAMKLQDAIDVLNGGNPTAHSEREAKEMPANQSAESQKDQEFLATFEKFLASPEPTDPPPAQ